MKASVIIIITALVFLLLLPQVGIAVADSNLLEHDANQNFIYSEEEGQVDAESGMDEQTHPQENSDTQTLSSESEKKEFIKWIDLNADVKSLKLVLALCKEYQKKDIKLEFSEVLAYLAIKNGNKFCGNSTQKFLKKMRTHIDNGGTINELCKDNKYYTYYVDSYKAIFDGIVGEFKRKGSDTVEYGVSGYFPLAQGFWYNHYDDFGASRGYGYRRRHLGHDFMGGVGTPIIAMEGGTVTELGWNRYGGWRVGIRSHDTKRYYYYAHLRKDKPFAVNLKQGDVVEAGQVIGFLGNTGYSIKENVNLKTGKPHLHAGLQIIFDKSQEKGAKEIWVDLYAISSFLSDYRAKVIKDPDTKEWTSTTINQPIAKEICPLNQLKEFIKR